MKADNILVSTVMPVYNCEKYIIDSIKSVLAQNINGKMELILVDDMGKDESIKKAEAFLSDKLSENFSYKIVSDGKNNGPGGARNLGVNASSGKYIAFLDADDIWAEGKIQKQLDLLSRTGNVISSTGRIFITADGTLTDNIVGVKEEVSYKDLLKTNSINLSSVLIEKAVIEKYPMSKSRDVHEDYVCWLKILKEHGNCSGINEPLLLYRKTESSVSGNKKKSALKHYNSLRAAGINPVKSLFCFASYAVNGVIKHRGIK